MTFIEINTPEFTFQIEPGHLVGLAQGAVGKGWTEDLDFEWDDLTVEQQKALSSALDDLNAFNEKIRRILVPS